MEKVIVILESSLSKYTKRCEKSKIVITKITTVVINYRKMFELTLLLPEDDEYKLLGFVEWKDDLQSFINHFEVPIKYRNLKTISCDHCNHNRFRKKGYIIENKETKVQMIVGKSCLDNYITPIICSSMEIFEKLEDDDYKLAPLYLPKIEIVARIYDEIKLNGFKSREYIGCSTASIIEHSICDKLHHEYDNENFKLIYNEIYNYYLDRANNNEFCNNLESVLNLDSKNIEPFEYLGFLSAGVGIFFKSKEEILRANTVESIEVPSGKYEEEVSFFKVFHFDSVYGTQFVYQFINKDGALLSWKTASEISLDKHNELIGYNKLVLKFTVKGYDNMYKNNKILRVKFVKGVS